MQGRFTVPLPTAAARVCVVCAEPLDWRAALTPRKGAAASPELYPLCRQFDCRMVFEQGEGMSDTDFRHHLRWRAQVWRQEQIRAGLRQGRIEAENREAAAVFDALQARAGQGSPPDLRLTTPSGHARLRPLSQRRRRRHAGHLDLAIAGALAAEPPARPAPIQTTPVQPEPGRIPPARLCGVCGGGCCPAGGDGAYLSAATIQRVMAGNPELTPAQLRATYLGYLPQRTIPKSCVYHTRGGCSLPRSLRADVCNIYLCAPLRLLQASVEADPPVRKVAVLRRRQNNWNQTNPELNNDIVGGAVLTEAGMTRLRPPRPGGWTMDDADDRARP